MTFKSSLIVYSILIRFGHPFEIPLLAQSIIMIITMLGLVELCVRVKNRNVIGSGSIKNRYFFGKFTNAINSYRY